MMHKLVQLNNDHSRAPLQLSRASTQTGQDFYGLSMVVSSVSLVSTTKMARSLAGSVVLAFSLIR